MARLPTITLTALLAAAAPHAAHAQAAPEKPEIHLAAAGLGFPYLPFMVASQRGSFREEGLAVRIAVFQGGAKALEALLGGSADVVAGAYSNTITMGAKGQKLVAFAIQADCPDWVFGVTRKSAGAIRSVADLVGKRIGVSSPGSSFHMGVNYLLTRAGLKPSDVSIIGIGSSSGAVAAARAGLVDALMVNDPVATILMASGDLHPLVEMRTQGGNRAAFGGDYTEAAMYTTKRFAEANPRTVQAVANAIVKAERWLATATAEDVAQSVPPDYVTADKAVFAEAFRHVRCLSRDGRMTSEAAKTVLDVLTAFDPVLGAAKVDLGATYDNTFVERAPK
ncbi:ABC transporter substrate-binding protein [Methylobacterium nodulans]|uniref:Extracellular solute-binding protein n=1 Tax=Methylobacterium nodulans (strain LMG 21967 / CNCM I-2342 / ORS 2060) TaxID=460265 RepID=B8IA06_METNO|nr:ABC transporter substrate-binding protein [Methylobacterium nodulans]ACL57234.1 extracellular solute-binding protein [Methylobacterium nodulans ORS 2060]